MLYISENFNLFSNDQIFPGGEISLLSLETVLYHPTLDSSFLCDFLKSQVEEMYAFVICIECTLKENC
jgi:hypothetical protein